MTGDSPSLEKVYASDSVEQTETLAAGLKDRLSGGGVVALQGELGAGKTQFVRGLVRALGGDPRQVHSPTFILLHEYALAEGRRLFHVDAYRIGADDLEALGFDELLAFTRQGDVVAVEWPQKVASLIPEVAVGVQILVTSPTARQIRIT